MNLMITTNGSQGTIYLRLTERLIHAMQLEEISQRLSDIEKSIDGHSKEQVEYIKTLKDNRG